MLRNLFILRGGYTKPRAVLVNGSWRKPAAEESGRPLALRNRIDAVSEPRPVSTQKERIQSRIVKAKKRCDSLISLFLLFASQLQTRLGRNQEEAEEVSAHHRREAQV
jgi:hypothetical protein